MKKMHKKNENDDSDKVNNFDNNKKININDIQPYWRTSTTVLPCS